MLCSPRLVGTRLTTAVLAIVHHDTARDSPVTARLGAAGGVDSHGGSLKRSTLCVSAKTCEGSNQDPDPLDDVRCLAMPENVTPASIAFGDGHPTSRAPPRNFTTISSESTQRKSFASGETTTSTPAFQVPASPVLGPGHRHRPLSASPRSAGPWVAPGKHQPWQPPWQSETLESVFERFTDRARRVLVLAQEEARLLNHGFIGTEHMLLGLIREGDGVAARALAQMDISLEDVRTMVEEVIGLSATVPVGSPPFTPRAKKVLELSLREAIQLGHNYIGTEHMLLGLVREGEGVAAQVLVSLGADLARVRETVLRLLDGAAGAETGPSGRADQPARGWRSWSGGRPRARMAACSFCGRRPPETGQLVSGTDAFICERCIRQWFEALSTGGRSQAISASPAQFVLIASGGPPPEDEDAARAEIAAAYLASATTSEDGQSVPSVEMGEDLGPTLLQALERNPFPPPAESRIDVDAVAFVDAEHAAVWFTITIDGIPRLSNQRGDAVLVDGAWKMARSTFCALMTSAGVACPPRPDR